MRLNLAQHLHELRSNEFQVDHCCRLDSLVATGNSMVKDTLVLIGGREHIVQEVVFVVLLDIFLFLGAIN